MAQRILIIEDNQTTSKLTCVVLERAGFEVLVALTAPDGLRMASEEAPDLIILDVMLPGMDGYQVCRYLRSEPSTASIPILMFTGKKLPSDQRLAYQLGASDYLNKPANANEILDRVRANLFFAQDRRSLV